MKRDQEKAMFAKKNGSTGIRKKQLENPEPKVRFKTTIEHNQDYNYDSIGNLIPNASQYVVMTDFNSKVNGRSKRIIVPVKNEAEAKLAEKVMADENPNFFSISRTSHIPKDQHFMNKDRFYIIVRKLH